MRRWKAWASERLETRIPVALVGCGLLLDAMAEDSIVLHGLGFAARILAIGLCLTFAARGVGRFGNSPLAVRFSLWRAGGLVATASCLAVELFSRWPLLLSPTDGGFVLDLVGILWVLLTGAVWGPASWRRLAPLTEPRPTPSGALGWRSVGSSA